MEVNLGMEVFYCCWGARSIRILKLILFFTIFGLNLAFDLNQQQWRTQTIIRLPFTLNFTTSSKAKQKKRQKNIFRFIFQIIGLFIFSFVSATSGFNIIVVVFSPLSVFVIVFPFLTSAHIYIHIIVDNFVGKFVLNSNYFWFSLQKNEQKRNLLFTCFCTYFCFIVHVYQLVDYPPIFIHSIVSSITNSYSDFHSSVFLLFPFTCVCVICLCVCRINHFIIPDFYVAFFKSKPYKNHRT